MIISLLKVIFSFTLSAGIFVYVLNQIPALPLILVPFLILGIFILGLYIAKSIL